MRSKAPHVSPVYFGIGAEYCKLSRQHLSVEHIARFMLKLCHGQLSESALCCTVEKLRPVMIELAFNLESFNPAFTAVLLKVNQLALLAACHCMSTGSNSSMIICSKCSSTRKCKGIK